MTESTRNITIMTAEYGTFDHGRLEDYISGRAACDFSVEAEDEEGLWIFLCQIFPDPEVRKYALTVLGSCLDGDISDQNIYFWRGGGSNGKTMLLKLLELTFGKTVVTWDTHMYVGEPPVAGAPNPELARAAHARFVLSGDLPSGARLSTYFTRVICGGGTVSARGLNEMPIEYKPKFRNFIICNRLPGLPAEEDDTVVRRMRVIPFETTFVGPGDYVEGTPNMSLRDSSLSDKMVNWGPAFFKLLLNYRDAFVENGRLFTAPAKVIVEARSDFGVEA